MKTMDEYLTNYTEDDILSDEELAKLSPTDMLTYYVNQALVNKVQIAQPEIKKLGDIEIFKDERSIAEHLQRNRSVALYSKAQKWALGKNDREKVLCSLNEDRTTASIDDKDLYYVESILVSANWNKNDDVFKGDEIWTARHTPIAKPSNLNHEESKIVGHINCVWAIDNSGNLINDDTPLKSLPAFYHLAVGSVLYLCWSTEVMKEQTSTLIEQIEGGSKYVSMECLFADFDYAVGNDNGYEIIERNDESSFLTAKLKVYGGDGSYKGKKVGRLLKDITFVGKGYVDKPANTNSVIL